MTCSVEDLDVQQGDQCGTITIMLPNNTTQEVLVMCSSLLTQMHMTARFVYNASAYVMEFIGLHEDGTTLRIKPINVSGGLIVTVLAININDNF